MRAYEALILFDSKEASANWDALKGEVIDVLKKHGVEILRERKWSDRKLAHEIRGVKRGTYLLVHFKAKPEAIDKIRNDMKLSESVLRELIVRLETAPEAFEHPGEGEDPETGSARPERTGGEETTERPRKEDEGAGSKAEADQVKV